LSEIRYIGLGLDKISYSAKLDMWEPSPHKTLTAGIWLNITAEGGWKEPRVADPNNPTKLIYPERSFGCTDVSNNWQGERRCEFRIVLEKQGNWSTGGEVSMKYGKATFSYTSGITRFNITGSFQVFQHYEVRNGVSLVAWVVRNNNYPNSLAWIKEADPYN
jgi:hypothetical protein